MGRARGREDILGSEREGPGGREVVGVWWCRAGRLELDVLVEQLGARVDGEEVGNKGKEEGEVGGEGEDAVLEIEEGGEV